MMCLVCTGCSTLSGDAEKRMEAYQEDVEKLTKIAEDSASKGQLISEQLKAIEKKFDEGTLTEPVASSMAKDLIDRGEALAVAVNDAKEKIQAILVQAQALRDQEQIPLWYTAASTVGTILTILTGGSLMAARKRLAAGAEGIQVLVSAIEKGATPKEIKTRVKDARNGEIETEIRKLG